MTQPLQGFLETRAYPIDDLVRLVTSGEVRVPSFQRGLRWTRRDVEQLFDSIVSGYPIGNLLFWKRSAAAAPSLRIGAIEIDAPATQSALFVVDGQQRLTSLASALSAEGLKDSRFALSYDLTQRQRRFVPYKENAPPTQIPLPTLFNLTALLRWFTDHPVLQSDPELIDRANSAAKSIREFRVPVYVVDQADPEVLREIFDRMNNAGRQLTRSEVFTALHEAQTGERTSEEGTEFTKTAEQLHAMTRFGLLDQQTVFLAFLARRGPDITRDIRREFSPDRALQSEFPSEELPEAVNRTLDALSRAVRFLQADAEVPHFALLPNRYLLVVLARFFSHFPEPGPTTRRNLRRWLWRTMLRGPEYFKGSASGATRTLASRITPGELVGSVQALLDAVAGPPPRIRITQFKTNFAATRLLLNGLWAREPYALRLTGDSGPYSLDDLHDALGESNTALNQVPQIVPNALLPPELRGTPGNRLLLAEPQGPADDVLDLLVALARRGIDGDANALQALESHLITLDTARLLVMGHIQEFVSARQASIEKYLQEFTDTRAEWRFEDTPPLSALVIPDDDPEDPVRDDALD